MITTRAIHGVVPVVVTPFNKNEKIDEEGLQRLIKFLISLDIGGLWVLGTGSEDMNLSFAKRLQVARIVTESNAGKLPLILGAGFFAMEDILNFIEETKKLTFDAYHVMPDHTLLSFERLEWFYRHIADYSPKPVWMYTSANWSKPLPPAFIAALSEHPNIAGVKYSTKDSVNVFTVASMAKPDFQVITAVAAQFYSCLCAGSPAHTSSLASALPEAMIEIYQLYQQGQKEEAKAAQRSLNQFLSSLPPKLKEDNFLQAAQEKYIVSLRGICDSCTSSYYRSVSDEEKSSINELVKKYYPACLS